LNVSQGQHKNHYKFVNIQKRQKSLQVTNTNFMNPSSLEQLACRPRYPKWAILCFSFCLWYKSLCSFHNSMIMRLTLVWWL